jgi:hypothetical protein
VDAVALGHQQLGRRGIAYGRSGSPTGALEHRGVSANIEVIAAVFGNNDPAGELLASRGWSLGDFTSGLGTKLREPDVLAPVAQAPVPVVFRPFREIDHRPGWYAGVSADAPGYGKATVLYYDNRADPTREEEYAGRDVYAWHTRFWSFGGQTSVGDLLLVAQAMHGSTAFEPQPGLLLDTRFRAGYLLAAWQHGEWRPAVRIDLFNARQSPDFLDAPLNEHGNALTIALNWRPADRIRITGELLRIDSTRDQRRLAGVSSRQIDNQLQVSLRFLF